jgi:hypothetical protein
MFMFMPPPMILFTGAALADEERRRRAAKREDAEREPAKIDPERAKEAAVDLIRKRLDEHDGALTPFAVYAAHAAAKAGALEGLTLLKITTGRFRLTPAEQEALSDAWPIHHALDEGGRPLAARLMFFRTGRLGEDASMAQEIAASIGRGELAAKRAQTLVECPETGNRLLEALRAALSGNWVAQAQIEKGLAQRQANAADMASAKAMERLQAEKEKNPEEPAQKERLAPQRPFGR